VQADRELQQAEEDSDSAPLPRLVAPTRVLLLHLPAVLVALLPLSHWVEVPVALLPRLVVVLVLLLLVEQLKQRLLLLLLVGLDLVLPLLQEEQPLQQEEQPLLLVGLDLVLPLLQEEQPLLLVVQPLPQLPLLEDLASAPLPLPLLPVVLLRLAPLRRQDFRWAVELAGFRSAVEPRLPLVERPKLPLPLERLQEQLPLHPLGFHLVEDLLQLVQQLAQLAPLPRREPTNQSPSLARLQALHRQQPPQLAVASRQVPLLQPAQLPRLALPHRSQSRTSLVC
jgi:hypothetical protein